MAARTKNKVSPTYKTKYRVQNWAAYKASLRARGDVTVWFGEGAVDAWASLPLGRPGGQQRYSDLAILTTLTLRTMFHLPLRQAEGFVGSLIWLLDLRLATPDHTTLSRRGATVTVPPPTHAGPLHLGTVLVGDFDGDGIPDVVVSAPGADTEAGVDAGTVYFLAGPIHVDDPYRSLYRSAEGQWSGPNELDSAGSDGALAGGTDLDGDGIADLVVGAPGAAGSDRPGAAWVLPGGPGLAVASTLDTVGARLDGERPGDRLGDQVSLPGDVDGDGAPDLLVGSDLRDSARTAEDSTTGDSAGAAWVVYGPLPTTGAWQMEDVATWRLTGTPGDSLGASLPAGSPMMGDGNDDGLDDLLIGAPGHDGGDGAVYEVYGRGE